MLDQAHALRGLMNRSARQRDDSLQEAQPIRARTISVSSGKGGVGKSSIALNLAVTLAQAGAKVCLLDANLGLGSIDLMCGLNGYWNLSHVMTGARTVEEVLLSGPAGLHVLSGGGELTELGEFPASVQVELSRQLETIEQNHDYVILDTGAGVSRAIRKFLQRSDLTLIVTTPEPTALADAYATVKALASSESCRLCAVVNRADSSEQAQIILERLRHTSRVFLERQIESVGWIDEDPAVPQAIWNRVPFVLDAPHSPAARGVRDLARRVKTISDRLAPRGFFRHLAPHGATLAPSEPEA